MNFLSCLFGTQTQSTEFSVKNNKCKCCQHLQTLEKKSSSQISRYSEHQQPKPILSESSRSTPKTLPSISNKNTPIFNKIKRSQSTPKFQIQNKFPHKSKHKNVYTRLYESKLVTAQQILKNKQKKQKKQQYFIYKNKNLKEVQLKTNQNKQNVMSLKRFYFFHQVSKLKAKLQSSAIQTTNEQFQFLKIKYNLSYQKQSEKQLRDIMIVYANFKNWDSNNRLLEQNLNKSFFNQDFLLHWQFLKNQHQKIWGKLIFFHNLMRIPKQINRNDQLPKKIGQKLDKILIKHKIIMRNKYKELPSLLPYIQNCVQRDKKPNQAATYSLKKSLYNTWLLMKSQQKPQKKLIKTATPWICQITSNGRYIWRSNRAVEANDTRILLQFLFFNKYNKQINRKTTNNSVENDNAQIVYPFVHINTGIHGEPSVKSAIQLKNSSFIDPRITMQTCLVIFTVFQKYIEKDFKELANIYNTKININNATLKSGLMYPNTDHIIDTHSFGGNYYLKIGNEILNFWYIDPNIDTPQNEKELSKREKQIQIQIINDIITT